MMSLQLLEPTTSKKTFVDLNHADKVSEIFEKFYQEQKFLDVVLVAAIDNFKVKAHRVVVSAASDYFMGMFSSTLKEANSTEIELRGFDGVTLLSIIEFIYSGTMVLHSDTVQSILIAADFLQMSDLIDACRKFMTEHLEVTNCLDIASLADQLSYTELSQQAYSLALENFNELCNENDFLELNPEQLITLISCRDENYRPVSEENIFLSICSWVDHDKENREPFLFDILSVIDFQLLTPKFIIENRHSVCTSVECYELILSWMEWHLLPETHQCQDISKNKILKKKNILLIIPGGTSTDDLKPQMFKSQMNWWSNPQFPRSPVLKGSYGATVINDQLIIVGGRDFDMMSSMNSVECLHLETLEWSELPPMQHERHNCAVTELNGEMYAIAGYSGSNLLTTVEKYNFVTGKWSFVAPLLQTIRIAAVAVLYGMIYAIDVNGTSMQCYSPTTNEWATKSYKQGASRFFGFAAACGYLYTVGGRATVERYNPSDDTWSFVRSMDEPRSGVKCAFLNNRIVACGGRCNDRLTDRVEEYNPRTDEWKTLTPLPIGIDGRSKIMSY